MATSKILLSITLVLFFSPAPSFSSSPHIISPTSRSSRKNVSFAVRLIHRSSPESPFYDPNATREDLIREGVRTSSARNLYFSHRLSGRRAAMKYAKAPISRDFVTNYSIGTPPVAMFGILDTGSDLIWLQCLPCVHCFKQTIPIFVPRNSSTYKEVLCGSIECTLLDDTHCDGGNCSYELEYLDHSSSRGVLSTDTLALTSDFTGETILSNTLFGCGYDNSDKDGHPPGVIGLGNHRVSLLGQLFTTRFSYLLSANSSGIQGWVYFGLAASISGFPTPLVPNDFGMYFLILEGILLNGERLDIPPEYFQMTKDGTGGFAIDTGTTYTSLTSYAFDKLKSELEAYFPLETPESTDEFEICYAGLDISLVPIMEFSFKGYNLTLCQENVWIEASDQLHCLAMERGWTNLSLFGMYQQRNLKVGYDLAQEQLTFFYPSSCPPDA